MIDGVDPSWLPLFDLTALGQAEVGLRADRGRIAPPSELVFEAFRRCAPASIAVVIVGQDPYPGAGDAHGFCFSTPQGRKIPQALARVFGCLDRAGLRETRSTKSGDLRSWAAQGVLLLNMALTTRIGERRAHAAIWRSFVMALVSSLCAQRASTPLHFLLWGSDAAILAPFAHKHGHIVHSWSHPSPMGDNARPEAKRFRMCPHFEDVNRALRKSGRRAIDWDNQRPTMAFCDGACSRNGQPDASAAYAAVVCGPAGSTAESDRVLPVEYEFANPKDPRAGVRARAGSAPVAATNNRAELLGFIRALHILLRSGVVGQIEIISDSRITIKTMTDWLPARRRAGTAASLANFDLVQIAERSLAALLLQASVVLLTHTNSHTSRPAAAPPGASPAEAHSAALALLVWRGNDLADRLATKAVR